jgi:ComF family protein
LSTVVYGFKYRGNEVALSWMAKKIAGFLAEVRRGDSWDFIVPVPLHSFRLLRRGFNQALLLGRALQREISIPLDFRNLVRRRYEKPQSKQGREERLKQIKDSFAVLNPSLFKDKKLLLLDDVYTTGATLNECSKVLKKTGAEVEALTLARTLLHSRP